VSLLCLLPPVGRGGEERKRPGLAAAGKRWEWCFFGECARRREVACDELPFFGSSSVLPWWRGVEVEDGE
jgi:hypothetical protein